MNHYIIFISDISFLYFQIKIMPDYLGDDQRKTKQKDDKDDDKPIKGKTYL
jgi:hypothetical protein